MARKKKGQLPSGSIRKQVYIGTDVDGKRKYKSFTGSSKQEVDHMIAEWKLSNKEEKNLSQSLNVYDAVRRYIDIKEPVVSPSTIKSYEGILRNHIHDHKIATMKVLDITSTDLQIWISDIAVSRSPKTVRNIYMLMHSSITFFRPNLRIDDVTLPQPIKPELYCPNDEDVRKLLNHIKGTDFEIAVYLAAFGPMRRSEICALTSSDIHGHTVHVNKAVVINKHREYVLKTTKTYGSTRDIEYPDFVIQRIKHINGKILDHNPNWITRTMGRTLKQIDVPHFRFHDLRHYSASILHAIGVPDQYIMNRGGWSSDQVMKRVYRDAIDIEVVKQNKIINAHFQTFAS